MGSAAEEAPHAPPAAPLPPAADFPVVARSEAMVEPAAEAVAVWILVS